MEWKWKCCELVDTDCQLEWSTQVYLESAEKKLIQFIVRIMLKFRFEAFQRKVLCSRSAQIASGELKWLFSVAQKKFAKHFYEWKASPIAEVCLIATSPKCSRERNTRFRLCLHIWDLKYFQCIKFELDVCEALWRSSSRREFETQSHFKTMLGKSREKSIFLRNKLQCNSHLIWAGKCYCYHYLNSLDGFK